MSSVTRQLDAGSSKFKTGAVTGLLERRKLCLPSANLRKAPQPDQAVSGNTFTHASGEEESVSSQEVRNRGATRVEREQMPCVAMMMMMMMMTRLGWLVRQWRTWARICSTHLPYQEPQSRAEIQSLESRRPNNAVKPTWNRQSEIG